MRVDGDVMIALSEARCDGPKLLLGQKVERGLYTRIAKVVEAAGGRWSRKDGAHVFDAAADEAIEPILLTGEVQRTKQDFGQFDTPLALAARVVAVAGIETGMSVLEPSAGIGNLAAAAIAANCGGVMCVEIDSARARQLVQRGCRSVIVGDFLAMSGLKSSAGEGFDRVVMNPPFARQADIDHVRHAASFLKPGGRLVSIMSAGIRFRTNRKATDFRTFLGARGGHIEPLPEGSFAESGTNVSAVIVVIPGRSA